MPGTALKDSGPAPLRSVLLLFLLMMLTGALANAATLGLWQLLGHSAERMMSGAELGVGERFAFRIGLMINHAGMFLIPGMLFCRWILTGDSSPYLRLDWPVRWRETSFWALAILFSYPLVGFFTQINDLVPLPDWARSAQTNAFDILGNVLKMEGPSEFWATMVLVGILPALGEELIFRGLVQNKLIGRFRNHHLAIVLASVLFGAIHFQLERMIPLTFLGLLLGYSYHYSRSFWVPVLLHFLINGSQVGALYFSDELNLDQLESTPDLPLSLVLGSVLLTAFFFYLARKMTRSDQPIV